MHPLIEAAGIRGEYPVWACLSEQRRDHARRVSELIGDWADELAIEESDRIRWRAAGLLHDALKDADPDDLRELVSGSWPDPLLHAPAVAERLCRDGVEDEELLLAVRYHSVGHPDFGPLAEHLYLADFLEPGRTFQSDEIAALRERMPDGHIDVLREVAGRRISRRLEAEDPLLMASIEFWNRIVGS